MLGIVVELKNKVKEVDNFEDNIKKCRLEGKVEFTFDPSATVHPNNIIRFECNTGSKIDKLAYPLNFEFSLAISSFARSAAPMAPLMSLCSATVRVFPSSCW